MTGWVDQAIAAEMSRNVRAPESMVVGNAHSG
ncbi:MAG: hypothetical protein RIS80_1129 [Actinomycetota bacterium]|jgi:hypothetical protein